MSAASLSQALALLVAVVAPPVAAQVVISEFMAANDSALFDGLGEASDWIELYNPTPAAVNLTGWKLRDSASTWSFPGTTLPAGGFLVVFASGKSTPDYLDPAGYLHTTFKLESTGEPLALLRPDGTTAHEYAAPVPAQREDISYGLTQEITPLTNFDTAARILVPGAAIDPAWRSDPAFDDGAWIAGQAAAGFSTSGAPIFSTTGIPAYRVATSTAGNQDYGGPLGMDFVVNTSVQVNELGCFDDTGNGLATTITVQLWRRNENGTPGVFTDDTGQAVLATLAFTAASPGTALEGSRFKALPAPVMLAPGAYTIVAHGYNAAERNGNLGIGGVAEPWETNSGEGRLSFVGGGRYGAIGAGGSFPGTVDGGPANRYAAATFKFGGSDDPTIRTNLQAAMFNNNASALMRIKFTVADPAAYESLLLRLPFDDGCVVWLNGVEIARRNAPDPLAHNSTATAAGNAIDIAPAGNQLVPGENILAIHGLNVAANDSDFFFGAQVSAVHTNFTTARYFATSTPWAPNPATGALGYVADTQFSVDRGFFDAPFEVAIITATPGATIRYTLDGSPPSATNGTAYTAPIPISTTTVLRALATAAGLEPTNIDTHTYLFPHDSAVQSSAPPPGYPSSWAGVAADYGMMSNAATYAQAAGNSSFTPQQARAAVAQSIRALPVLSIVTDKANLFDPATGIYVNPGMRGEQWERPVSAELLTANGSESFQADAGLQIMGLTSRNLSVSPKLNLRLLFKTKFGGNWLNYPFFGNDGPSRVKSVALRSNTRDSWLAENYGPALFIANAWSHRAQADSGQPATRSRYMHLFINGLYWGLYDPTERPEEHWAETVLGGEDEDYDVLDLCCGNRLEAGDFVEWQQLLAKASAGLSSTAAYQEIQGNNPDGTRNPAFKKLLDVDNLIDFLINGYFTASGDWPGNFFAIYDNVPERTPGFRFPTWDNDLSFQGLSVNANKVTPPEGFGNQWWQNSPGAIDAPLRANPDYRIRLADHVYRHFFHGGAYDTPNNVARWNALIAAIEPGLYAESARWGDYRGALRTVQTHWRPRVNSAVTTYFPQRRTAVLGQLRSAGLYPSLDAPEFNQNGGSVPSGFGLQFTAGATIYYTHNGRDPRQPGGAADPTATTAASGGTMTLMQTGVVRARAFNGTAWSAVHEATFIVGNAANAAELIVTELHYHPAEPTGAEFAAGFTSAASFEFLELTNVTTEPLDLTGCRFTNGIDFAFTGSSITVLAPGAALLIVANRDAALARYGAAVTPMIAGEFANDTNLNDNGERLTLVDHAGQPIFDFTYADEGAWPAGADGTGASLVFMGGDPANPANWRISLETPTPGEALSLQDEWGRAHFTIAERGDPAISGDLADPDHDGLSNFVELCTHSDPRRGDSGHDALTAAIQPLEVGGATDRYLVLTFRRIIQPGYTVALQSSPDLSTWSDATAQLALLSTNDPRTGWQTLSYRSVQPFAPGAATPTFWRLRASRP